MTPRPRNATFAIEVLLPALPPIVLICLGDCDGAPVPSTGALTPLPSPLWWRREINRRVENVMAPTKQQVLDALAKVASPDGEPLTATEVLSDVVGTDGKVFFSMTVDAAAVQRWEPVRKRAEEAVRAVAGVQSALVALTAERKPGAAPARPAPARRGPAPP